ncbi:glycosyltransferase [Diplogelasinospora grovesii]|uniref:GPI mannosyltransferase 2 n=1 Tax=Diplogelasinospora grovesii TaxID=303347 RepID=A0AAN6NKX7_9PEZI|nr:glycosyltransferase [Diplogelasinospora grovesii]
MPAKDALTRPHRAIIGAFAAWKLFLLAIASCSAAVSDAYDTSATLLVGNNGFHSGSNSSGFLDPVRAMITRLTAWDAIYFVSIARRGYRFEQEWAFGTGFPTVISGLTSLLGFEDDDRGVLVEAVIGVAVANTAHLLSALVLYRLGLLLSGSDGNRKKVALIAAICHVLSPAGMFLAAPNPESSFSLLSFTGYLLFALSCSQQQTLKRDGYVILAGVVFGLATAFRSNGILNGIPFAFEVLRTLPLLLTARYPSEAVDTVQHLAALGIGGVCVAAGSVIPQAIAYQRYCTGSSPRGWCQGYLPSIYAFVQEHYWNNGFLRYWTLSNLPLFLLAAPMLTILVVSGVDQLKSLPELWRQPLTTKKTGDRKKAVESDQLARLNTLVFSAAAAQLVLALLTFTTSHVQIITRISSGYPLWYLWLAKQLTTQEGKVVGGRIVMFMVIYATVQGALFASFLPPA